MQPLLPRLLNLRPGMRRTKSRQHPLYPSARLDHCSVAVKLYQPNTNNWWSTTNSSLAQRGVSLSTLFFFIAITLLSFSAPWFFPGGSVWAAALYYNSYTIFPFLPTSSEVLLSAKPAYKQRKMTLRHLGCGSVGSAFGCVSVA
jgi:hypothetical protein